MRTVVPNHEVIDLFMRQAQPFARNPKKSLYFEGPCLYSYGPHYMLARFLPRWTTLFVSWRDCSPTTRRHQSLLSRRLWRTVTTAREVSVYDAAKCAEEELAFRLSEVARTEKEIRDRIRRPRTAVRWFALREARALRVEPQARALGLPVPTVPELPEDLLALKAACMLRGYTV